MSRITQANKKVLVTLLITSISQVLIIRVGIKKGILGDKLRKNGRKKRNNNLSRNFNQVDWYLVYELLDGFDFYLIHNSIKKQLSFIFYINI